MATNEVGTLAKVADAAIRRCGEEYPGAAVYGVKVTYYGGLRYFRVELQAEHFSQPLRYVIREEEVL